MTQNNVQLQNGNGSLAGLRNQIINGNMLFWQRGYGPFTSNEYTADRWILLTNGSSQVSRAVVTPPGVPLVGPPYGLSITNGGTIRQMIELPATGVNGAFKDLTKWTLSWYQSSGSTRATAACSFRKNGITDDSQDTADNSIISYTSIPSILNGFDRYQVTFDFVKTPNSPNNGLAVDLTFSDTAATIVTTVQFESGYVATPFEEIPIGLEESLCQRYFQSVQSLLASQVSTKSDDNRSIIFIPPTTFRVVPTLTVANPDNGTFVMGGAPSVNQVYLNVKTISSQDGGSSADVVFDAEL